jgi:hydrogenase nickel incorporation protein HypB
MPESTEVRQRILQENDRKAASLRERFKQEGTLVVNMVSSSGSGKTTLLEQTIKRSCETIDHAVMVDKAARKNDSKRLHAAGASVHAISTGKASHFDAQLVADGLETAEFLDVDMLFLENVGNLDGPGAFDLGEDFKAVLLSAAEGDDQPVKNPEIFSRATVCLITKSDLLPNVDFDIDVAKKHITALNPNCRILELSALSGEGMDAWCTLVKDRLKSKRTVVV